MKLKIGKKSGLRYFDMSDLRSWKPCYDPSKHLPEDWRGTAVDILEHPSIPFSDKLWVVCRTEIISDRVMRLFAVWCARQVQHLMKDARSIAALDVAERFANGEATKEELDAAWAAAWAAARDPAWDAARAAARAAWDTARDAASDAAWDAARAASDAAWAAAWDAARAASDAAWAAAWDTARDAARDAASDAARAAWDAQKSKLIEMVKAEGMERKRPRVTQSQTQEARA